VPDTLSEPELRQALGKAAAELNIDVQIERGT
jgi:hypothetical protein